MSALLRKPLWFAGIVAVVFVGMTGLIWGRIATGPPTSYQLGFPGWLTVHRDGSGWSFRGVDNLSLALQIAFAVLVTWIIAKTIDWKPLVRQPGKGSSGSITIGLRVQAVAIFVLVAFWHYVLLITLQRRENAPVLFVGLFFLLPLLTTLLALIVLETRIRYRERGPWWAYLSIFFGLVPWIWAMYAKLSA